MINKNWALLISLITLTVSLAFFQNCGNKKFDSVANSETQASVDEPNDLTCDNSQVPDKTKITSCSDINSDFLGSIQSNRSVSCQEGQWLAGAWSSLNIATCRCSDSAAKINTNSQCVCPAGFNFEGGKCKAIVCNPNTKPSDTEFLNCPAGDKNAYKKRAVTCSGSTWVTGSYGAINYNQCKCSIAGGSINPATGDCACPAGKLNVNNVCVVPDCTPGSTKEDKLSLSCPEKGKFTNTKGYRCNSSGKYEFSFERNDLSSCSCNVNGAIMNTSTGSCACPAGQANVGGTCMVPKCDENNKQSSTATKSCPNGIGTAKGTRSVTCNTSNFSWIYGEYDWNYDDCSCADARSVYDKKTLKCIKHEVACSDAEFVKPVTKTLTFSGQNSCNWNAGGNGNKMDGKAAARVEEVQNLNIPANATLCSISIDVPEQSFRFDDHVFIDYGGMMLAGSYNPIIESLSKIPDSGIKLYDWSKMIGKPSRTEMDNYCIPSATCKIPRSESDGAIKISLPDSLIRRLSSVKALTTQHTFRVTTTGDNDSDKDCRHTSFKMNVKATYVVQP